MEIKNSIEWSTLELELKSKILNLEHNKDIKKIISNIGIRVTELSKTEVEDRRTKSNKSNQLLLSINNQIIMVEEFITIACLLG